MLDPSVRHGFRKPPTMSVLILARARDFSILAADVSQRFEDFLRVDRSRS